MFLSLVFIAISIARIGVPNFPGLFFPFVKLSLTSLKYFLLLTFFIIWFPECFCLFVLRFYGPVNPVGSCRARSVYLTTCLLGRLSPLSG